MMGQPWHGSYGSYLEDDEAIARELHQSYNSYVADDAAIARELQEMEDSLGTMALYDGAFGSIIDSAWEGNLGGTSANRGGTSANHGGSANRGGTSIRETNVRTRDGGEVDLDNMSYEEMHRFEESMGTVSKGLSRKAISRLPVHKYSPSSTRSNSGDAECVICKMEYERGDRLVTLPCAHQYHEDCIKKWMEDNKNCCVCKEDVAVS
ncbi:hypothetical protein Peur_035412 [Populus x canadensis]|uniref:E3 ubiquitin ligase BIG BROTHER-related-like n=1 Tax=Populus nigra TaxID=3691 RepID=UPI002B271368|nr:E3 ubiquitin ligase BIG BROTHER-related-like [Populus nigra]